MFKGLGNSFYNLNEILSSVNQEELFLQYFGIIPNSLGRFYSPFRSDRNPGCRFSWYSGILYLVENTMYKNKLYWNIVECLQEKYNLNYSQAINIIIQDYKIELISKPKEIINKSVVRERPVIRFTYLSWKNNNLFYLTNEQLQKENIYLVDDYWIGRNGYFRKNPIHDPKENLTVAYHFPDSNHVKLYFPNKNKDEIKWYSNCDINDVFGKNKVNYYATYSSSIIITKSQKDRIILDYKYDIPAVAVQNEGSFLPDDFFKQLKTSFVNIYTLFDNDDTGKKVTEKYKNTYGIDSYSFFPESFYLHKDTYEYFKSNNDDKS